MGSIGAPEILVILVVALIVLGPERLPEAARQVGRFVGELRRIGAGFQAEVREAMNVSPTSQRAVPAPPPGPSPEIVDEIPPPRRPDDEQ